MDSGVTGQTGDLAARHVITVSEQEFGRVLIHHPLMEENPAQAVQTNRGLAAQWRALLVS